MEEETLLECSFLIPLRRDGVLSDGDLHSTDAWTWLDDQCWDRFQGFTTAPGTYSGSYRDPDTGARVFDQSQRYVIALPEDRVGELKQLLAEVCSVFKQKCIYLSVGGRVYFVEGSSHGLP